MTDDRKQNPPASGKDTGAANKPREADRGPKKSPADKKPENTFEGDGSPGLTISGGGGHA